MPATLKKDGDQLVLSLSGHSDFKNALALVKQIPGRRFDGETKNWLFPANEQTAMRICHSINPSPDAEVMHWLRDAAGRVAEELTQALPDRSQADLLWHPPAGLELFDFQPSMIDWAARFERVLIADDMGVGKTPESIGAVQEWLLRNAKPILDGGTLARPAGLPLPAVRDDRPKLVIAGTTKLGDWHDELKRWAPDAPVMVVPGDRPAPRRRRMLAEFERDLAPQGGWLVVNHEQLRASEGETRRKRWQPREPWFAEQEWLAIIADEAHRFKNRNAQQTRGLHLLSARLRYALTGTPVINSPDELWAILAFIRPDAYEEWSQSKVTYWQFFNTYVESYAVEGRGLVITGVKNGDDLRFELADKWARRTKKLLREKGLLPAELPPQVRIVQMRSAQLSLYKEAETALWLAIEQDIEALEPDERAKVLAMIERGDDNWQGPQIARLLPNAAAQHAALRQIATSPALLGGKDESGKLDAVVEDITDHEGKPFVVFTWHRRSAELVAERLVKRKLAAEYMHGGTSYDDRADLIRRFDKGEVQVLVCTIKTGGEGLNLVRADTALFVEQADTVAANDQARDRLDRLGQENPVNVIIYRSKDTVETEKQAPRLRMKAMIEGATMGRDRQDEEVATNA